MKEFFRKKTWLITVVLLIISALISVGLVFLNFRDDYKIVRAAGGRTLPWLNFGDNLMWNANTSTLYHDSLTQTTSATYIDGSSAYPFDLTDPVLGVLILSSFYPVFADLSISFDSDNTNDFLRLVSSDGSGIIWLDAQLDVSDPTPYQLGETGNRKVMIKSNGLTVASGAGSRWADEFASSIYTSFNYSAELNIVFDGSYLDQGGGIYKVSSDATIEPSYFGGYAWSENIGWIDFNPGFGGVSIDLIFGTGNFSGYAWSENIGWISFEENDPPNFNFSTNCDDSTSCDDPSDNCTACYNSTNHNVYGWAKILSLGVDGWIKMSDDSIAEWNGKGVSIITTGPNKGDFKGWAWNGNGNETGIGWISFNSTNCWTEETPVGGMWIPRSYHRAVVFNGKIWVMGGYSVSGPNKYNDVWSSSDGINWTEVLSDTGSPGPNQWSQRINFGLIVFNNRMWVLGGEDNNGVLNDVWWSTDGITWNQEANAGWGARKNHGVVVFDDGTGSKIWVLGGVGGSWLNDVWYSDDGVNWFQKTTNSPIWWGRSDSNPVAFDDGTGSKMWILGGNANFHVNDIWSSSDGINWTEVVPDNLDIYWEDRYDHTTAVYNNKIWVLGGDTDIGLQNDVWYSEDGSFWEEANTADWEAREGHATVVFNDRIWVLGGDSVGGVYENDVWWSICPEANIDYEVHMELSYPPADPTMGIIEDLTCAGSQIPVRVNWTDNSDNEIKFEVYRSTDRVDWSQKHCELSYDISDPRSLETGVSRNCSGLVNEGIEYYFRVKAIEEGGKESGWAPDSNGTSHTTGYCPPVLSVDSYNCDSIDLSWAYGGTNNYTVYRKVDSGPTWDILVDDYTNTDYTDTDIVSDSIYEYYVEAKTEGLDSNETGQISPCPSLPTWIEVKSN